MAMRRAPPQNLQEAGFRAAFAVWLENADETRELLRPGYKPGYDIALGTEDLPNCAFSK